jgi:hypothetical protein
MDKRNRSPNYPALSLPDAIGRVSTLYKNIHTHAAPREVVAKALGYKSLSGPSATAISSLAKYGLIERAGEELKVSERSLRIIHPHSDLERIKAIKEAARDPELFAEIFERFSEAMPNDELLRNFLARKSFVPSAASTVILSFRETLEFVNRESLAYDSRNEPIPEDVPMSSATLTPPSPVVVQQASVLHTNERPIGRYDFEDGSYVRIIVGGDIGTDAALDMVATLIELKRRELAKGKSREMVPIPPANGNVEKRSELE